MPIKDKTAESIARAAVVGEMTRTNHRPGTKGKLKCPICEDGTLYFRQAQIGKHTAVLCSTKTCVSITILASKTIRWVR